MSKAIWVLITALALAIAVYAVAVIAVPVIRNPLVDALLNDRFLRGAAHMAGGAVALAAGALQFSRRLRQRRPKRHRSLGVVYVATVMASGIAGVALAPFSDGGLVAHTGFGLLGLLWVGSTGMAYRDARAGDYGSHRR
jgi:uncharacterized membrane protein